MNSTFVHIWKYPALLGVLTLFGLLAALTGTGFWHVLSWIAMALPVAVSIRYGIFARRMNRS
jgi:hypothetical protein